MKDQTTTWDEVRRIADEIELKIHLAGMDARDRWRALQPRVVEIEKQISSAGKRVGSAIDREVDSIGEALRRLRDDVSSPGKPS
jgi:hypothetical protein